MILTNIDELNLTEQHKKDVLVWYANKLWKMLIRTGISDTHCKSYDPLEFDDEERVVHSYVFDLHDGGRHHEYKTLREVEDGLDLNALETLKLEIARNCKGEY